MGIRSEEFKTSGSHEVMDLSAGEQPLTVALPQPIRMVVLLHSLPHFGIFSRACALILRL
jgi:hypothetical protein